MAGLPNGKKILDMFTVSIQYMIVTDRRTDRQTLHYSTGRAHAQHSAAQIGTQSSNACLVQLPCNISHTVCGRHPANLEMTISSVSLSVTIH